MAVLPSMVAASSPVVPSPPVLVSDTGTSRSDNVTSANNSASSPDPPNAPVFHVFDVEPDATVVLYRNNLEVSRLSMTAGGTVAIADLNGASLPGRNPIPDATYTYKVRQIDRGGNPGQLSLGRTVTIDHTAPMAPSPPILQPGSDTSNGANQTTWDNSPDPRDAPVFDVINVELGASLQLFRAPVVGGVVGTFVQVNSLTATAGGTVAIADLNDGKGKIAEGSYVYQARMIDRAGNVGPASASSASLTVDTVAPAILPGPRLNPASDTGSSNTDHITAITASGYPIFDVSGVEGGATVRLYRLPPGGSSAILVGTMVAPASPTPINLSIVDTSSPTPDGVYSYTAEQVDRAGNVGAISVAIQVTYDTSRPPTPGLATMTGATGGATPTTSNRTPTFVVPVTGSGNRSDLSLSLMRDGAVVASGGKYDVNTGTYRITDPGPVPDGIHTFQTFLTNQAGNTSAISPPVEIRVVVDNSNPGPTLALDPSSDSGTRGDDVTGTRSPSFDVADVPAGSRLILLRDGRPVGSVFSASGGTVSIGDPGPLLNGRYAYSVYLIDGAGNVGPAGAATSLTIVSVKGDYDGDGRADLAVFRRVDPGVARWFVAGGIVPPGSPSFGAGSLDVPFQGDLDGDGRADLILYRPSTSQWFVQQSSRGPATISFGGPGDIPTVGDFDGVGHTQLAVYRPSTGEWFVGSHGGVYDRFGGPDDTPVPLRNYYGNGRDVLAVYRASTGHWFVAGQGGGINFGGPGDIPMPLFNYFGDGRDALGVYRPGTSHWFVGGLASGLSFGGPGDIAVAADFDGVGRDQLGVYRPSTGEWFVAGHATSLARFGGPGDVPPASPYAYRSLSSVDLDLGRTAMSTSPGQGPPITPPPAPAPLVRAKPRTPKVGQSLQRSYQAQATNHDPALSSPRKTPGRPRDRRPYDAFS